MAGKLDIHWLRKNTQLKLLVAPNIYHCDPIWSWSVDSLDAFELWCVLDGYGVLQLNGAKLDLAPGSSLIFAPLSQIEVQHNPTRPLKLFACRLEFARRSGELIASSQVTLPQGVVYLPEVQRLEAAALLSLDWRADSPERATIRDAALWQIMLMIVDTANTPWGQIYDKRIDAALKAIKRSPAKKWTVDQLARKSRLSSSQFSRLFTRQTGMPPIRYVIYLRYEIAKRLMAQTSLSLKEIAAQLGYQDVPFFAKQFKKLAGVSPGNYRLTRGL